MKPSETRICGVILAGGRGSRLDYQHKPLIQVGHKRIIEWIIESASQQTCRLVINVNRDFTRYEEFDLPLIPDLVSMDSGPLAGIHATMSWARQCEPCCTHIACFPGDVPWFEPDLVQRLLDRMIASDGRVGWLQTGAQWQPLFSLWELSLAERLGEALQMGLYSPLQFIRSQANAMLSVPDIRPGDYLNINTQDDLAIANAIAHERSLS